MNDWDANDPVEGLGMTAAVGRQSVRTFFERITKDIEIVRVALLLTGCIQVRACDGAMIRRKDGYIG